MKPNQRLQSIVSRVANHISSRTDTSDSKASSARPLTIEALEPRVLFSGAPASAPAPEPAPTAQESPAPAPAEAEPEAAAIETETAVAIPTVTSPDTTTAEPAAEFVPNAGVTAITLTEAEVAAVAEVAAQRWIDSGISAEQSAALAQIDYQIVDLSSVAGNILGATEGNNISIDDDAAGRGWFVDQTPEEDGEFELTEASALTSGTSSGIDLLSVLLHEQGHALGLDAADSYPGNIMNSAFVEGERRLPVTGQAEGAIAGSLDGIHFAYLSLDAVGDEYTVSEDGTLSVTSNSTVQASGENATTVNAFDGSASNSDLINSGQSTFLTVTATRGPTWGLGGLHNGVAANNSTDSTFYQQSQHSSSVTFTLDTSANTNGYDIDTIRTIAGWSGANQSQANQKYEVLVSQVGSASFSSLGLFEESPFSANTNAASSTRITITDSSGTIASNVDAIRFNILYPGFVGNNSNNGTVFREFDVEGSASASAPAAIVNLVQNGSFETGTNGLHTTSTPFDANWNILPVGGAPDGEVNLVQGSFGTVASDGAKWLSLESNGGNTTPDNVGTVTQTITTEVGKTYELNFDYNALGRDGVRDPWNLFYDIGQGSVALTIENPPNVSIGAWQHETARFVADSSSTTLSFTGDSKVNGWYGAGIDNVSVVEVDLAEVIANDAPRNVVVTSSDTVSANDAVVSVSADGGFTYDPTGSATIQALAEGETLDDTFSYTVQGAGTPNGVAAGAGVNATLTSAVPDAANYTLAYELAIPNSSNVSTNQSTAFSYAVDNASQITQDFSRIGYYLELDSGSGPEWVFVTMDAFTAEIGEIGIPHPATNPVAFQQLVSNMDVFASAGAGVTTGTGIETGNIEMWAGSYTNNGNAIGVPNATSNTFDFGDTRTNSDGYGSFQIHNHDIDGSGTGTSGETILAYNRWGNGGNSDLGIGNRPGTSNTDWTFAQNANSYTVKNLQILVLAEDTATVTVQVIGENDSPTANDDTLATDEDTALTEAASPLYSVVANGLNPLAYWEFNEGSGTTATDSSGNGQDGTLVNGPSYVAGRSGDAGDFSLNFDGSNDRVDTPIQYTLSPTDDFTWTFWTNNQQGVNNDVILGNRGPGSDEWVKFTTTQLEYQDPGSGSANINYADIPQDQWVFHTAVKEGDTITYYRDGAASGTSGSITFTAGDEISGGLPFYIGGDPNFGENWQGQIDDVALFGSALSAADVSDLFNAKGTGLLANDTDPDTSDTLTVAAINGVTTDVGTTVTLASGAEVNVAADGSFTYNPNGQFEDLAAGQTDQDTFTYSIADNPTGGIYDDVPEANQYSLVYDLAIPDGTQAWNTDAIPYSVDNSAGIADGSFDRIAYYLELDGPGGPQHVFVSADAFTADAGEIGVPSRGPNGSFTSAAGSFQQILTNMNVTSNVLANRTGVDGNIEFWSTNYGSADGGIVPGNSTNFDIDDTKSAGQSYGSMQIHDFNANEVLFAYNAWGSGSGELGIGTQPTGRPDWTFAGNNNAATYTVKNLQVFVRETATATVTVTGVNDAPEIGSGVTSGAVTEIADGAAGENADDLTTVGSIAFTDVDLLDTHTVGVTEKGTGYVGGLTATIDPDSTGTGAGEVDWDFTVNDADVDYLAAGETLTQTYTLYAEDNQGASAQPGLLYGTLPGNPNTTDPNPGTGISIDLSEANDTSLGGNTTEVYTGQIFDLDGIISFRESNDDTARLWIDGVLVLDDNAWNNHTTTGTLNLGASTGPNGDGWHDFELRMSNGGGGAGAVGGAGFQYDPDGGTNWQKIQDTPGLGESILRHGTEVTVTMTGSNDAPVITIDAGDSAAESVQETNLASSGTLGVEDVDLIDWVEATVESVTVTGSDNGIANATLESMMTVANPVISSGATTGDIAWVFDSGSEGFDYLADGDSLVLDYEIEATDYTTGQIVRIFNPNSGSQDFIHLREVEIYSDGVNIAPSGTTSQSSTYQNNNTANGAYRVIDGNLSTFNHTLNTGVTGEWLEVDLGAEVRIDEIFVYNRTDCCSNRLNNYTVEVLDASRNVVWNDGPNPTPAGGVDQFTIPHGMDTQNVTVTINGENDAPILPGVLAPADGAATASSSAALAVNDADIAQLDGTTDPGGNVGHVWSNRPIHGQTFTTGSNADGYDITSVSLAGNTDGSSGAWTVRIGILDGSNNFTALATKTASTINKSDRWITWDFDAFTLDANTTYAFDVDTSGRGFISYTDGNTDSYAGGTAFSSGGGGNPANPVTLHGFDRAFHVDLAAKPAIAATTNDFNPVSVSDFDNDGDLVSHLLNGAALDLDDGALPRGIAITSSAPGTGTFEFSQDDGGSWNAIGAVSESTALLLLETDRVRFVPDGATLNGGSITFRAWDQTGDSVGDEGTAFDITSTGTGDTSPFSLVDATSSVIVANVVKDEASNDIVYTALDGGGGEVNHLRVSIDGGQLVIVDDNGNNISSTEPDFDPSNPGVRMDYVDENLIINTMSEADIITFGDMTGFTGSITVDGGDGFDAIETSKTVVVLDDGKFLDFDAEKVQLTLSELTVGGTGSIDINAYDPTGSGAGMTYTGLWLYGSDLTAEDTAAITLAGGGGDTGTYNNGIKLTNGSDISTAGGNIDIDGAGGGNALFGTGVALHHGSSLSAGGSGNLTIDGTAGAGSSFNEGVFLSTYTSATVADGDLTITGTGNGTGSQNQGVDLSVATLTATGTGNIAVIGSGSGSGTGTHNTGVTTNATDITTTTGTVTLAGTGGGGTSNNQGVRLAATDVTTTGGSIDVDGTGNGSAVYNTGVQLVGSTLDAGGAGTIDVDGTAGAGTVFNEGVQLSAGSTVKTDTGAIGIRGTGMGTITGNRGVTLISSTAESTGGGDITLLGTASAASIGALNDGISLTYSHATTTGTLTMAGTGGAGSVLNSGVKVVGGSLSGVLDIDGTGGGTASSNAGVYIMNSDLGNSPGTITGTGGAGSGVNFGAFMQGIIGGFSGTVTTDPDDDEEKGGNFFPTILPLALVAAADRGASANARRNRRERIGGTPHETENVLRRLFARIAEYGNPLKTEIGAIPVFRNLDQMVSLSPIITREADLVSEGIRVPQTSVGDRTALLLVGDDASPVSGAFVFLDEEGGLIASTPLETGNGKTTGQLVQSLTSRADMGETMTDTLWTRRETGFKSEDTNSFEFCEAFGIL